MTSVKRRAARSARAAPALPLIDGEAFNSTIYLASGKRQKIRTLEPHYP